jgi:FdhE protein
MTDSAAAKPGGPHEARKSVIGEPDFARLPDPSDLFKRRAERLAALAGDHRLGPYLMFLSRIADAQNSVHLALPLQRKPDHDRGSLRLASKMPPLCKDDLSDGEDFTHILDRLCRDVDMDDAPEAAAQALARVIAMSAAERLALADAVFDGSYPAEHVAESLYVAAALQVHLARLASALDPNALRPAGAAVCPVCGSMPVASVIVGWAKADHARYCCCGLCGSLWNYVRIKCTSCESTAEITYYTVEEQSKDHAAEACGVCRTYIKHLHHHRDSQIEALADDLASFGLDVLMRDTGFHRAQVNPFMVTL